MVEKSIGKMNFRHCRGVACRRMVGEFEINVFFKQIGILNPNYREMRARGDTS